MGLGEGRGNEVTIRGGVEEAVAEDGPGTHDSGGGKELWTSDGDGGVMGDGDGLEARGSGVGAGTAAKERGCEMLCAMSAASAAMAAV